MHHFSIVGGDKVSHCTEAISILYHGASHRHRQCRRQQRQLMKTIFVLLQRTRSPSHNCQSCNKSLCGTNEYGIGNETKLIGMLCQLDSIHPFHTRPFTCEVARGCLSLSFSLALSVSPREHPNTLLMCKPHTADKCRQMIWANSRFIFHFHNVSMCFRHKHKSQHIRQSAKRAWVNVITFISARCTVCGVFAASWLRAVAWHSTIQLHPQRVVSRLLRATLSLFKRRVIIAGRHSKWWHRRF